MITDLEVVNYQAIGQASIRLGRFTVVTGPTGSGKSALIRAIELVVSNARGTSYIRHGAKACKAALGFEGERTVVGIERGGRGADKYRLVTLNMDPAAHTDQSQVQEFTKLAGQVPDQVTRVLCLGPINFARQFDSPYLLNATGGQVARTLGELTNITLLFDAAREANRRKQETSRQLKAAEADLAALVAQAATFRTLAERRGAAFEAREHLACVDLIEEKLARLRQLQRERLRLHQESQELERRLRFMEVPSAERLEHLRGRRNLLRALSRSIAFEQAEAEQQGARSARAAMDEEDAHRELHELLVAAGACPTCGQVVKELAP